MKTPRNKSPRTSPASDSGGPPCAESQADGVPCEELGQDCEDCEKAESQAVVEARQESEDDSWAV